MNYAEFIRAKSAVAVPTGIDDVPSLGDHLAPFQADVVRWALRRGRAAMFLDTGLGKTRASLEWASQVCGFLEATEQAPPRTLILAPLAVAEQTVREGERICVPVHYCRAQSAVTDGITITNYDMLDRFDTSTFGAVVLDESSILKSYDGPTRTSIIEAFAATPFRLSCSATPAPNEYDELGSQAQFLGIMSLSEMRAMFFVHDGGETQKWRLKGHAKTRFWRWVCSWAAMVKRPSDLGYDDAGYVLPPLTLVDHVIPATQEQAKAQGLLFAEPARTLQEQRAERRTTLPERARIAADIIAKEPDEAWLVWCELNDEAAELCKALPGAVEIRGSHTPDVKRDRLMGFCDGSIRVLVTKPSIAGAGMNFQHAARMVFLGLSHSFEAWYQAVRREWRFGQKREVICHVITSEGEGRVVANLRRKEADAEKMSEELRSFTADVVREHVRGADAEKTAYDPREPMALPTWLVTDERGLGVPGDEERFEAPAYPGETVAPAAEVMVMPEWIKVAS